MSIRQHHDRRHRSGPGPLDDALRAGRRRPGHLLVRSELQQFGHNFILYPFRPDNPSQGVAFTVNQVSTLDSIVANLAFEIGDTIGVTSQLFELGMSEKDKFGTPSYEYTLLGTSSPISVTGNDNFSEHTLSFSGQELDSGSYVSDLPRYLVEFG